MNTGFLGFAVATVLTVYGIETLIDMYLVPLSHQVATVLTVYGIETRKSIGWIFSCKGSCNSTYRLRY